MVAGAAVVAGLGDPGLADRPGHGRLGGSSDTRFHGRLILELVPAFFLLIAAGTGTLCDLGARSVQAGLQAVVLFLLLAYPSSWRSRMRVSVPLREFNPHGDITKKYIYDMILWSSRVLDRRVHGDRSAHHGQLGRQMVRMGAAM